MTFHSADLPSPETTSSIPLEYASYKQQIIHGGSAPDRS